jgi:D-alanyl-D-alanine carboxypeptidase (penicillin-binding protein 5/6)
VAAEDVAQGGFMTRIRTVSGVLLTRLQQGPEGAL